VGMRTVLVANRGEVAVRIIRACRELGLRSVAVFSDADAGALHVRMADEAHRIGPAPARSSYLDVDALLGAAKASGADAVHPGYGMLAEDAGFAAAVDGAGLVFVGPPAAVVARMGDKVAAREVAVACGVPVPPGSPGPVDPADLPAVIALAGEIGYPVVVKASFGGGGRGIRVVDGPAALADAVAAAAREAGAAFGRSEVHLERYLDRARHVEVQVLGDTHGTVVHLGDRDCSVQRRHQKLIEEAPAPGLDPALRESMADAALRIARHVGYVGAGTVEFLVQPGTFVFLEMNTRLQVEHGVTELVTGVDLVVAQLRIAGGEPLWFNGAGARGHAIEARIAAEDPWVGFRPSPGRVTALQLPQGPGVRNDAGLAAGDAVPAEYDSMFAKVLAHGSDRDSARRRLIGALDELRVGGVPTTAPYLRAVLASESFSAGTHDTGWVEREWPPDPAARPATAAPRRAVRRVRIATDRGSVEVDVHGRAESRRSATVVSRGHAAAAPTQDGRPIAPMDATVVEIRVAVGDTVAAGDVLAVLEAMKMEMPIRSGTSGTVTAVHTAPGASVTAGSTLVSLAP
jgi:acetyl-CoA/propionyl-CoA carboxylase, biotin carboxylase, biotin carboxyl carrier protein